MEQKLIIEGRLPSLNEIIDEARYNRYASNNQKQTYNDLVYLSAKSQNLKPFTKKINLKFSWYCKDRRRDKDNIMAGQKYVLDGLQLAGIIENDGWKEIGDIYHKFYVDKDNERIEILMKEVEE